MATHFNIIVWKNPMDRVAQWCWWLSSHSVVSKTLCDPMDCSTPGFPVLHHIPELAQTYVPWGSDAIQLSLPLSSPSPPALTLSQHQGLFQWVSSSHQVAEVLELQPQHQSFQWIFRIASFRVDGWISLHSKGVSRLFSNIAVRKHQKTEWAS